MKTEAQKRATRKYNQKTYENILVRVKKGEREEYKDKILNMGYVSINQFILDAINEKIEREKDTIWNGGNEA